VQWQRSDPLGNSSDRTPKKMAVTIDLFYNLHMCFVENLNEQENFWG
jgi:hypothetical protein